MDLSYRVSIFHHLLKIRLNYFSVVVVQIVVVVVVVLSLGIAFRTSHTIGVTVNIVNFLGSRITSGYPC